MKFYHYYPLIRYSVKKAFSSFYKLSEQVCMNGDVKLEKDGTPKLFWNSKWSPICGHYFWNNHYGATSFCKKLGYSNGKQYGHSSGQTYSEDAIRIGLCSEGQNLENCDGGCNDKGVGNGCANCAAGEKIKLTIRCEGHDQNTKTSCKGIDNIIKLY